jgi:predicted phage terminase large subunit-like protein
MTGSDGLHGTMAAFVGAEGAPVRRWLEVFRGAMKSSLATVDGSSQLALRDVESRVLIMSANMPLSKSFLREIKQTVTGSRFKLLYPEYSPDKTVWNLEEASLLKDGLRNAREPTWKAAAVEVMVTGWHGSKIVYDDLVVPTNVESRLQAAKVISMFESWRPLLDEWDTPELMSGTPYKMYDLYAWMKHERPGWFHRLNIPLVDERGLSMWSERFPAGRIEELRKLRIWPSQYMLNPRPENEQYFTREEFRYCRDIKAPEVGDWSQYAEVQHPVAVDYGGLSYYIGVDPGGSVPGADRTALAVVGVDSFGNFYLVEHVEGHFDVFQTYELMRYFWQEYDCYRIGVEFAGPFKSWEPVFEAEMRQRSEWLPVEAVKLSNQHKAERVCAVLGRVLRPKKFYTDQRFRGDDFEQELLDFPDGKHDDVPDAVSHAVQTAQKYGGFGRLRGDQEEDLAHTAFGLWPRTGRMAAFVTDPMPLQPGQFGKESSGRGIF